MSTSETAIPANANLRSLTLSEAVRVLDNSLDKLDESSRQFATSLLNRHPGLSFNQANWIYKLIERALLPKQESHAIGSMAGVIGLFDKAGQKLKKPAVTISHNDITLRLDVASQYAKRPGTINVATPGSYGNNTWYGRITREGVFEPSNRATVTSAITDLLVEFAEHPAEVAARHGKVTGCCSFCNTPLSDDRSLYAGYGATCAKNYGLPYPKKSELPPLQAVEQEAVALAVLEAELTERAEKEAA